MKLITKGGVMHPDAYLRCGWDVLDGFIVLTSILSLALRGIDIQALKALRLVGGVGRGERRGRGGGRTAGMGNEMK